MTEQEKAAHDALIATVKNEIIEANKNNVNKSELEALKNKLSEIENKESVSKEDFDSVKKVAADLEATVKAMKESVSKVDKPNLATQIKNEISTLKEISKGANKELVLKADTLRTSVTNNQHALDLNEVGQLATAKRSAYDLFRKIPVSQSNTNGTIRYYDWDSATTVRAATSIAESGTFPESTAKWIKKTLTIEKVGDSLPVSEEFFADEEMFAAELDMFLKTNVDIKVNNLIVNGDGVSPNLKGIVSTVSAYVPVASGITDASIYDLIVKVSESITKTGGAKYSPDFAFMNITDINKMQLKKDVNNNYILPPFVNREGKVVAGVTILEENAITANTLVLGDSRFGRIYEMQGFEVSKGTVNTQFTEDMETLKIRRRLAFLIRDADLGGFAKVTSISAALVTLAS